MDLVSEISYTNKTCKTKHESTIENNVFRQEIVAYHNQLVYHENNLPIPKNTDKLILGNPVRDRLKTPSNISSNIRSQILNDENQLLAIAPISPVWPLNYRQQTNQRIISPEHLMKNNIKTQPNNRDHKGMVTKTDSPIPPLSYLQRSNQTIIDSEQASCSRNPRKTLVDSYSNHSTTKYRLAQCARENVKESKIAEKTTYCRPAIDIYNKQYVHETIQKNARLQVLVKRLALIREKEKQRIAWNNYINSLRNKHVLHKRSDSTTIPDSIPEYTNLPDSEFVENYITRPACPESYQSQYKLDRYSTSKYIHQNEQYHLTPSIPQTFNSNGPNFKTNSQEHSMMLNFEIPPYDFPTQILPDHDYPYQIIPRYYYPTTPPTRAQIFLDEAGRESRRNQSHRKPPPLQFIDVNKSDLRNISVQTNTSAVSAYSEKEICPNKSFQEDDDKQDKNSVEIIKKKLVESEVELKHSQLSTIDKKLDDLIYSINNFIHEIKSQKHLINMTNKREAINQTKSSSYLMKCNLERGEIKRGTMQDRAISNISLCNGNSQETLYRILTEEMHKSDKVKQDIKNIMNKPNKSSSSLHITFDIPTKDASIEIKDSFKVDTRRVCVKEISEDKRMTIAVNTDPLGLLGLIQVSAEAVKQLLSFVPSIDYYSYMSMLPLPAAKPRCQYVCNICGAAFDRPSCLSDHIQRHSLGRTKDCCICRHVLDSARQAGLFTCRHCGQKFTRAYCRELHQLSCARALGKQPDDSSSHLILR